MSSHSSKKSAQVKKGLDMSKYHIPQTPAVLLYLKFLNTCLLVGWFYVFMSLVKLVVNETTDQVDFEVTPIVWRMQVLALLESLNAFLGFSRSSLSASIKQSIGRNQVLFVYIIFLAPQWVRNHHSVLILYFAWSLIELVRYPLYILGLIELDNDVRQWVLTRDASGNMETPLPLKKSKITPKWLEKLRYNLPLVLYPIGAFSEMWVIFLCFDFMYNHPRNITLNEFEFQGYPIKLGINLGYYTIFTLGLYPIVFPGMFMHMYKRRAKVFKSHSVPITNEKKTN